MRMPILLAVLLLVLSACCCPGARGRGEPAMRSSARALPAARRAARRHGIGMAGVWSYLATTYDEDGDGRVTSTEYTRDQETFARMDRDEDGVLTGADFAGPARMDAVIAHLVLLRHLRDPSRKGPPEREEVAAAFDRLDGNQDGAVDRRELERTLAASRPLPGGSPPEVPPGVHVYDALLAVLDADSSGDLSLAEVETFRARVIERELAARAAAEDEPPPKRPEGPAVGAPAPDFTLTTLDGREQVTLADRRRERPVALIFGSWT